jgi:FkbM family methyltransferase
MSLFSNIKSLSKDLLPPIVTRIIRRRFNRQLPDLAAEARVDFYGSLLHSGSLCFDIGANIGNRVAAFNRLKFRVVALEPQPKCYARLQALFGAESDVTLVNKAVGSVTGKTTMMVSEAENTVSTMSQAFIDATTKSKRFAKDVYLARDVVWNKVITVETVTLDGLIAQYGVPDFIKIDVEGFELEVIRGLSRPVPMMSFEWVPELTDTTLDCMAHLSRLAPVEFNLSWLESMKLWRGQWMNEETLTNTLNQFREEAYLFGDVYVRTKPAS